MRLADHEPEPIRRICVYCASSMGSNGAVIAEAADLGRQLADRGVELVYGGGSVGLMGLVADTVLAAGGTVTGVIPTSLFPVEMAHRSLTRLIEVATMHERKAEMIRLSDGFVALPGGFGTLEELTEVLTWAQLGLHRKPVGLLNVDGFYDDLLRFFDRCVDEEVLRPRNRSLLLARSGAAELLDAFDSHRPTSEPKWSGLDRI